MRGRGSDSGGERGSVGNFLGRFAIVLLAVRCTGVADRESARDVPATPMQSTPVTPAMLPANSGLESESEPPEEFAGVWQDVASATHFVELESGRMRELHSTDVEFARASYDIDHVTRSVWGRRERWDLSFEDEALVVTAPGRALRLHKAAARPAALDPAPLVLGAHSELGKERLAALVAEFAKRRDIDQAVRTDATRAHEMEAVDSDNTAWLKELVAEIGWIDVTRFGKEAAGAAFLIVQHSGDLPLMMAVLPEIETDVRQHGVDPQNYALLWDRLQVRLGKRQRYGSQLGTDEQGRMVVIALEDRARVEELRKAIGLFPLKQYLDLFRSGTFATAADKNAKPTTIVFEDDEL